MVGVVDMVRKILESEDVIAAIDVMERQEVDENRLISGHQSCPSSECHFVCFVQDTVSHRYLHSQQSLFFDSVARPCDDDPIVRTLRRILDTTRSLLIYRGGARSVLHVLYT